MPKNKPSKPIHYPKEFLKEKEKEWSVNHLVVNSYVIAFRKFDIPAVYVQSLVYDENKPTLWIITKGIDECMDKETGEFIDKYRAYITRLIYDDFINEVMSIFENPWSYTMDGMPLYTPENSDKTLNKIQNYGNSKLRRGSSYK